MLYHVFDEKEGGDLDRWIVEHREAIQSGGASYHGTQIDETVQVVSYQSVMSGCFFTFVTTSPHLLADSREAFKSLIARTAVSLLFGWWAPLGFWFTIGAVHRNLTGGKRRTVQSLLFEVEWGFEGSGIEAEDRRDLISISDSAAAEIHRRMEMYDHEPGIAVRIQFDNSVGLQCRIEFDFPMSEGRDWVSESQGFSILLDKQDSANRQLDRQEMVLDYDGSEFRLVI